MTARSYTGFSDTSFKCRRHLRQLNSMNCLQVAFKETEMAPQNESMESIELTMNILIDGGGSRSSLLRNTPRASAFPDTVISFPNAAQRWCRFPIKWFTCVPCLPNILSRLDISLLTGRAMFLLGCKLNGTTHEGNLQIKGLLIFSYTGLWKYSWLVL